MMTKVLVGALCLLAVMTVGTVSYSVGIADGHKFEQQRQREDAAWQNEGPHGAIGIVMEYPNVIAAEVGIRGRCAPSDEGCTAKPKKPKKRPKKKANPYAQMGGVCWSDSMLSRDACTLGMSDGSNVIRLKPNLCEPHGACVQP